MTKNTFKFKITNNNCHELISHVARTKFGYVRLVRNLNGVKYYLAHRYIYALNFGNPGDLCVCHKCDNPQCVNADHLFLGTLSDNTLDRVKKNRTYKGTHKRISKKLSALQIEEIRKTLGTKTTLEMANKFNISPSMVSGIRNGRYLAHIGGMNG